jgi:hypothetical protein
VTPGADREQCPFCLSRLRTTEDGKLYKHRFGRLRRVCRGSGKTKPHALNLKAMLCGGQPTADAVKPEDIF